MDQAATHPLKKYLNRMRETSANGEYGALMKRLTDALSISKPTLYRLYYREGSQRRTLSPIKACRLELLTNGEVPASSVNDDINNIREALTTLDIANDARKQGLLPGRQST